MAQSIVVTTSQLIVIASAVFVAGVIQVVAGFGFGLLSVPLMTIVVEPKIAIVVSSLIGACITSWQAIWQRADVDWTLVRPMIASAYVGMPLGLVVFSTVNDDALRLVLGVTVIVAVVLLVLPIPIPVGRPLDIGAGFISGVLNTSLSTNGPPLVFALQARRLASDTFRATIVMVFALSNFVGITLFFAAGKVTAEGLRAAAIAIPATLVGQAVGIPLRRHVHGERFRWMVLGLLLLAGISAIYASVR